MGPSEAYMIGLSFLLRSFPCIDAFRNMSDTAGIKRKVNTNAHTLRNTLAILGVESACQKVRASL